MTTPSTAPHPIPPFYHTFFTTIDPLIALSGVVLNVFFPETVINSYRPLSSATTTSDKLFTSPTAHAYTPETQLVTSYLLYQISGALLFATVLDVFLLRRTREVWI